MLISLLNISCTKKPKTKSSYAPISINAKQLDGTAKSGSGVFTKIAGTNFSILLKNANFKSFDKNNNPTENSGSYSYKKSDSNIGILTLHPVKGSQKDCKLVVTLNFIKENAGTYAAQLSSDEANSQQGLFLLSPTK